MVAGCCLSHHPPDNHIAPNYTCSYLLPTVTLDDKADGVIIYDPEICSSWVVEPEFSRPVIHDSWAMISDRIGSDRIGSVNLLIIYDEANYLLICTADDFRI